MWLETSATSIAWVSWRPPQTRLHYTKLYRGLWEFLRMPPKRALEPRAKEYLCSLRKWASFDSLQQDRIAWVEAWLAALPMEERRKDLLGDTTYRMLEIVVYEPPERRMAGDVGRLRAG